MIIFKYELAAWICPISDVTISEENDSVEISCFDYKTGEFEELKYTYGSNTNDTKIDMTKINKIKEILIDNLELMEYDALESPPPCILDGVINSFTFGFDYDTSVKITGHNLWAMYRKEIGWLDNEHIRATKVVKVFELISDVLKSCGVDEKYLRLV